MSYPQSIDEVSKFSFFQKPYVFKKKKILYPLTKGYSQCIAYVYSDIHYYTYLHCH